LLLLAQAERDRIALGTHKVGIFQRGGTDMSDLPIYLVVVVVGILALMIWRRERQADAQSAQFADALREMRRSSEAMNRSAAAVEKVLGVLQDLLRQLTGRPPSAPAE
jgi:hypothetical protein